jgi:outer membrane protein OmpA-like peptidoglycan-associated protein
MCLRRWTVSSLAALGSLLGTLVVTAAAQASAPPSPIITSIAIGGSDLTMNGTDFYTNDAVDPNTRMTVDAFTVTVAGDPNASSISLFYDGATTLSEPPNGNGVATFTVPAISEWVPTTSGDAMVVSQTVNGQTSDATVDFVLVGNVPVVDDTWFAALPVGGTVGVSDGIPGDTVELFVDGHETSGTADGAGTDADMAGSFAVAYHTAYAETVDAQGVASAPSAPFGFYVDPASPTVQTPVSSPDGNAAFDNQSEPNITVSGVLPGATVNVYQIGEDGQDGATLDAVTSASGGTLTLKPTTPVGDGQVAFDITQTVSEGTGANQHSLTSDIGQSSHPDSSLALDIDTAAPSLQTSFSGSVTSNRRPSFLFSLSSVYDKNAEVRLIDASTHKTLGQAHLDANSWRPAGGLAYGKYSVYAVTVDADGDVGSIRSASVKFTIEAQRAHKTTSTGSVTTLFHFNSSRLTASAERQLASLKRNIIESPQVTISGYTAGTGPQSRRQRSWSARLSNRRADVVERFLFGTHLTHGAHLSVQGMGQARDGASPFKDRRTTITYEVRFTTTG